MKNEPAIRVANLSKKFDLSSAVSYRNPFEKKKVKKNIRQNYLAVNDLSFEIFPGEIVGLIGRNGSGKSTLLKLLSGLLPPTNGSISISGKMASILELGSGFHPDLTGLENILFTADLLGIPKKKIKEQTRKIIQFSEIKDYIHMPIKYYSQGMYLRLAFSIMTVLDFDIMLLDEIISVADESFKEKSQRTILKWMQSNKTMIIATHDIGFALNNTNKCLLLENGKLVEFGNSKKVLTTYFTSHIEAPAEEEEEQEKEKEKIEVQQTQPEVEEETEVTEDAGEEEIEHAAPPSDKYNLIEEPKITLENSSFISRLDKIEQINEVVTVTEVAVSPSDKLETGEAFSIRIAYKKIKDVPTVLSVVFNFLGTENVMGALPFRTTEPEQIVNDQMAGDYLAHLEIPPFLFNAGILSMDIIFAGYENDLIEHLRKVIYFEIKNTDFTFHGYQYKGVYRGPVAPKLKWIVNRK